MSTAFPSATILGYPRIGRRRELKKALEAHWSDKLDQAGLEDAAADIRRATEERLLALGLNATNASIPDSFSYYDQVLDAAVTIGAIPSRFSDLVDDDGDVDLAGYFTLARGDGKRQPLEMTKWFDSNYHYLVPEIGPDTDFHLADRRLIDQWNEARERGVTTRPVIVGPVTFALLSKAEDGAPEDFAPLDRLDDITAAYAQLLTELAAAGVPWVQLDEPALAADYSIGQDAVLDAVLDAVRRAYGTLTALEERPALFVTTAYGSAHDGVAVLARAGVEAIHLDLVKGELPPAELLAQVPATTTLVAGLIDGHNIWAADLAEAAETLKQLGEEAPSSLAVATSTSLFHVPHDAEEETALNPTLRSWLAFADQKVAEVATLARAIGTDGTVDPSAIQTEIDAAAEVLRSRTDAPGVRDGKVREELAALSPEDYARASYEERAEAQQALGLPLLPTTTIGSFPQTTQVRHARAAHRKGELDDAAYEERMKQEISSVVQLQEQLGLDVLVHGEPERNDMVQYFAENLDGFATTEHGWVQSYGSRCTRPPLLWGDVSRPAPITVGWSTYAQSLTDKPLKGMLTGPVTILAWSFVRNDQPLADSANQIALALRDEVADLQDAGIGIVQVDEPALRELLPLRVADQPQYLDWSVSAFRLATSTAAPQTQIHTHLCYSEFGEVIEAIDGLDADVTSIEAARSRMEVIDAIAQTAFSRGIGPGVYDIHSPRVPSQTEIERLLLTALEQVPQRQLWANPDCGLKTRGYEETAESLRNLTAAARTVREQALVEA